MIDRTAAEYILVPSKQKIRKINNKTVMQFQILLERET
jgi:hypothetical protein